MAHTIEPPITHPATAPALEAPVIHPVEAPIIGHEVIINPFGLHIPTAEAHIYGDMGAKHLFIYGGQPREQIGVMYTHLTEHPKGVVYGITTDTHTKALYHIPYHLQEGKVAAGPPIRTNGFRAAFSPWMKVSGPQDFRKLIR